MSMNAVERQLLREAIIAVSALVENDMADAITLEWKLGQIPKVTYVSNVPLEYVKVSFTVALDEENPFEPEETREQQDRRIGQMIRDNAEEEQHLR